MPLPRVFVEMHGHVNEGAAPTSRCALLIAATGIPAAVVSWLNPFDRTRLTSSRLPFARLGGGAEPPDPKPTYLPP